MKPTNQKLERFYSLIRKTERGYEVHGPCHGDASKTLCFAVAKTEEAAKAVVRKLLKIKD